MYFKKRSYLGFKGSTYKTVSNCNYSSYKILEHVHLPVTVLCNKGERVAFLSLRPLIVSHLGKLSWTLCVCLTESMVTTCTSSRGPVFSHFSQNVVISLMLHLSFSIWIFENNFLTHARKAPEWNVSISLDINLHDFDPCMDYQEDIVYFLSHQNW